MTRINVPPTRSNLLRIKQELEFAREGYEILDKKREVLSTELIRLAHDAETLQKQMWELLNTAYRALEKTELTMGQERVEWAALAVNKTVEVQVRAHGVMGVPIPTVEARGEPPEMPYSLGDTRATLDEASAAFREVLNRIPELSELMTSVWRLARELRKTQRRVNALQYIFIPDYEDTVAFIEKALEEREREETFRLKRLKTKTARPTIGPPTREYEQPYRDIAGGKSPIYRDISGGGPRSGEFG
ncbi:MAG: V-type ATP synthase subunit D [Anaerolineae bacterium]|jgi:V/A-type H+-transporting ATPase subunit D|nr:V-type ATP synthase subunit D [Anaerolineae bacterium]MDH7474849.1 V-type ATP synthase subunit D [Anaerolineae bacterium]